MTDNSPREIIDIPATAADDLRQAFASGGDALRISYISGPGNVVGTYRYWREGKPDPGVPSVTYSAQIYELARQTGASLQIVTRFAPPAEPTPGIRFSQVQPREWAGRVQFHLSQIRYRRDVLREVIAFDPHVVVTSLDFPTRGWSRLARERRLILSAHNTFWPMGRKPAGLRAGLRLKRLAYRSRALDGAVCTSHECARQISTLTRGRIDGRVEHPQIVQRHPVQTRQKMRKMLYLGRIEHAKGIFMLLDAFVALKREFPDLALTFAGAGPYESDLKRAIAEAALPDLQFLGRLESDDVHREIAGTDLVVCPTMSTFPEGLALVGLEAAAHGIPTLQSSVVPAVDLLRSACKTFEADDAADLARALRVLITDNAAYTGLTGHLEEVRPRLYDASLSWGSQLARVMLEVAARS